MGVVTGIVQEFQFGMNWSAYSRFVGDIFGAPLAFEGLMAFFFEATFIGLWIFGWDKLPKGLHLATHLDRHDRRLVLSAYFILAANAFMQNPVGYQMSEDGRRAEMVDFLAVLTNRVALAALPHTLFAAIMFDRRRHHRGLGLAALPRSEPRDDALVAALRAVVHDRRASSGSCSAAISSACRWWRRSR